ncbi:hypothetical protein [Alteromonas confluentis]|nr:hypothetical protein [Alteromonas confluentis]
MSLSVLERHINLEVIMMNMNKTLAAVMVTTTLATVSGAAAAKQINSQAEAMQHSATEMKQDEMSYVDERMKKAKMQAQDSTTMTQVSTEPRTWITLTGEVVDVDSKFFTLDYGEGTIFVELNNTDLDAQAYEQLEGKDVMVTAQLDDSLFSDERIKAQSVFVDEMETTYLADDVDQHAADMYLSAASALDVDDEEMVLVGTVKSIGKKALQLEVGDSTLTVELDDLDELPPLDEDGKLSLMKGERVRVTGEMEEEFFNTFTVEAEGLMKMKS